MLILENQIVQGSLTGLVKTILMIIGGMVTLRFFGQLMIAKRDLAAQSALKKQKEASEKLKKQTKKNLGKVSVSKKDDSVTAEDVRFEEVN